LPDDGLATILDNYILNLEAVYFFETSSPEHVASRALLHVDFLLDLFFDPEDGGNMFLRNVGFFSTDYTV
jgi:hypothetical protein